MNDPALMTTTRLHTIGEIAWGHMAGLQAHLVNTRTAAKCIQQHDVPLPFINQ